MGGKPRPPKGEAFRKPGEPSRKEQARHRLVSILKQAQIELQMPRKKMPDGLDAKYYIHTNRDGSIDAELMVKRPKGIPPRLVFEAVRLSLPRAMSVFKEMRPEDMTRDTSDVWVSSGARFEAVRAEEHYHRHKNGLSQVQAYYQEYTKGKSGGNMLMGQHVAEVIEKRQRKLVDNVFIRLHWNDTDRQPGRADAREDRDKKQKASRKPRKK